MTWDQRVQSEPTTADLAAIEAEWPLIEAELAVVTAEARILRPGGPSPLDWRRLRRAEHAACAAWLARLPVNHAAPASALGEAS